MSTLGQVVSSRKATMTHSKVQSEPWYTGSHEPEYMYRAVHDDFFHNCQNQVTSLSPSAEQIHILWNIHAIDYYTTGISKDFCKVLDSKHFLLWEPVISVAITQLCHGNTKAARDTTHTNQLPCFNQLYLWTIKSVCHNCHTTRYFSLDLLKYHLEILKPSQLASHKNRQLPSLQVRV